MICDEKKFIEITSQPLDYDKSFRFAESESCGAISVFIGTVRDHAEGRPVEAVEYHGYAEMAEKQLASIVDETLKKFPVQKVVVLHRLGLLQLKEASVLIMVSAPHRAEAFDACRFVIEEIKIKAPIWKKEHFTNGVSEWKNMANLE
jgi:molybdopterin synthase catalytic subunit